EGGERDGGAHHGPQGAPPHGETALGNDDHECREPQHPGDLVVLELDPEAGLADGDAQRQVDQQDGQAEPLRQPQRPDRDQEHQGAEQQREVEVLRHASPPRRARTRSRRSAGGAETANSLSLAVAPPRSDTWWALTPSSAARAWRAASVARPPTGGAVTATTSEGPYRPW